MLSIGDFARHGGVSLRVLRHYDAIGLLPPARVDAESGHRWYAAAQLERLNRILVLRDLGFGLARIQELVGRTVSEEDLRSMLIARRAELAQEVTQEVARLARVEARLRALDVVGQPAVDVVARPLSAVRVVELTGMAATFTPDDITPVIRPLGLRLDEILSVHGVRPVGHRTAYYERRPGSEQVEVHAAVPVSEATVAPAGLSRATLPGAELAAILVHHGPMEHVLSSLAVLAGWIDEHGHQAYGIPREVYLEIGPDESRWVTELQQPILPAEAAAR